MVRLAFYKAQDHLFNRLVAWWTNGPYSHVEVILEEKDGEYVCLGCSFRDGGVRLKKMPLPADRWDIVEYTYADVSVERAYDWYAFYREAKYDLLGLFGFIGRRGVQDNRRWFCSEAVADILRLHEPWRYDPNTLYAFVAYAPH